MECGQIHQPTGLKNTRVVAVGFPGMTRTSPNAYRGMCACGWAGPAYLYEDWRAQADCDAHVARAVAAGRCTCPVCLTEEGAR